MYYIGIDLGGTGIKAGLVDEEGRIIAHNSTGTNVERGYEPIIVDMAELIRNLLHAAGTDISQVGSIGVGVPGLVDYATGTVIYCTNLDWHNVPLAQRLSSKFGKPVYVENDATVAGYAESLFGCTRSVPNSVFLTLGTGIGGGIIINGKIYSGSHGAGSELGHMVIGENFYDCNCGSNGCFETFASATAIIKYITNEIHKGRETSVLAEAGGETENIDARMIFEAAKAGDLLANETVERMVKYMARGIANIYNVLDPDMIAIGGGVSKAGEYLLGKVRDKVRGTALSDKVEYGSIVLAQLGNEAGIIGAAFLGKSK